MVLGTPTYEERVGIYVDEELVNGRIFRLSSWLGQLVRDQKSGEEGPARVMSRMFWGEERSNKAEGVPGLVEDAGGQVTSSSASWGGVVF